MPPRVAVFFYGSYMNLDVLREVEIVPDRVTVARLPDFAIVIEPLANLVPAPGEEAWGIVADATHDELERLYAHARDVLGGVYRPHPVLVHPREGPAEPALCYLAADLAPEPASDDYVSRILGPAREFGFPAVYLARLESFRPGAG